MTDHDYADKRWLEPVKDEDAFALITPEQAVAALCAFAFIVSVFRDFL